MTSTRLLFAIVALVLVVAGLLLFFKYVPRNRSAGAPEGAATAQPSPGSEAMTDLKNLLFADQSLEELLSMVESTQPAPANDPIALFASAVAAAKNNRTAEAKDHLKQVLALRETESRIQLWAWKGLRKLGEQPPANIADTVQGVVCELHNEAGVGTLAAYADGRARWLGGKGAAVVWEVPGADAGIDTHIKKLLKAAEPLAKGASLSETHQTPEPKIEHFRVSILTYSGIRTVEVYGPSIEQDQPIAAVLVASVNLLDLLQKKSPETERKAQPNSR